MNEKLPASPESRNIAQYTELPQVYPPYAIPMPQERHGFDLRAIAGVVRRNWWLILIFVALGVGLATAYNRRATPIYQAAVTIRIGSAEEGAPIPLGGLYSSSGISTEMEVMRSRMLAEQVVDSLKLQVRLVAPRGVPREKVLAIVDLPEDLRGGAFQLQREADGRYAWLDAADVRLGTVVPGQEFRAGDATLRLVPGVPYEHVEFTVEPVLSAAGRVRGGLNLGTVTDDRTIEIVKLSYEDTDQQMTAEIANGVADVFIERRLRENKRRAHNTVEFLRGQIDTLDAQLAVAEDKLRDFREAHRVVDLSNEGGLELGRLFDVENQRTGLEIERATLSEIMAKTHGMSTGDRLVPSPYRLLATYPGFAGKAAFDGLLGMLSQLETERAELLERRTPQDPDVQAINDRIRQIEDQLELQSRTHIEGLETQLAMLDRVAGQAAGKITQLPQKQLDMMRLQGQADLLRQTFIMLQSRLKEAEIAQAVEDPNASIIDRALMPGGPIKPRKATNVRLGFILGLLLGVAAAYGREYFDTKIHTREDLKDTAGIPVLGLIPHIEIATRGLESFPRRRLLRAGRADGADGKGDLERTRLQMDLITEYDRSNAVSEAYRSLRTNITFSSADLAPKIFVVTSPTPKDGKTTTAANLAVTFAQQGLRVLVIDGDMRRGTLHKLLRTPRTPGLSNILVENCEFERAIRFIQLKDGTEIDVLPTGTIPPNPAELLASARMEWLKGRLAEMYDVAIIDTPPLSLVTDAAVIASHADTVLLVARSNKTDKGAMEFALEQLRYVRAPVRGAILNDVDFKRDSRYRYGGYRYKYKYYAYSYGPTTDEEKG